MRYISKNPELVLLLTNGKEAFEFKNGVLVVGDPTTATGAGNFIDPAKTYTFPESDSTTFTLMEVFPTDLAGATTAKIEMCGQGSLADPLGAPIGLRGYFFEAPVLTGTSASVPAKKNIEYVVLTGTVTYNGVTYKVGEHFVTDGTVTATTGTGTFALIFPENTWDVNTKALFKERHMITGLEARDYWIPTRDGGYVPRGEFTTTDIATGYGYIAP